jgi:hypothetical protein
MENFEKKTCFSSEISTNWWLRRIGAAFFELNHLILIIAKKFKKKKNNLREFQFRVNKSAYRQKDKSYYYYSSEQQWSIILNYLSTKWGSFNTCLLNNLINKLWRFHVKFFFKKNEKCFWIFWKILDFPSQSKCCTLRKAKNWNFVQIVYN